MLHKLRVLEALRGNALRQTRILLRLKPRPKTPVLALPVDKIVGYHALICRRLTDLWPAGLSVAGESVCEIGPGDCLAAAAYFIAQGAARVDLVELEPPVVNARQRQVLSALKKLGFPIATEVIGAGEAPRLNERLVSYHRHRLEEYRAENRHALVFSHNVMEHVEDLAAAFTACYRALRPGGRMLHIIDLGGHGQFEDPIPPLDFQTYPDWLFEWMYPVHHRNTRRFLADYRRAVAAAGFKTVEIQALRTADQAYVKAIHPQLRLAARQQPVADLAVIEFSLSAVK